VVVDGASYPVAPGRRSPGNFPEQKSENGSEKLSGRPEKLGESILHKLVGFIIQYGEGMTFLSGNRPGARSLWAISEGVRVEGYKTRADRLTRNL
jgi:hypothetical protein